MNMKYECWTYVNGKPGKMTTISAPDNVTAQILTREKFEKLGCKYDYIKCK